MAPTFSKKISAEPQEAHEMTDIKERLRSRACKFCGPDDLEAIAEIERLQDENELLRDDKGCRILDMKDEIERLQAELGQVREILAVRKAELEQLKLKINEWVHSQQM
jgi:predicted nuclease with TOPRIM domain